MGDIDRNDSRIAPGNRQFFGAEIRNQHIRAAACQCRQRHHDANRTSADHRSDIAGHDLRAARRLHANGERLDHRAFGKRYIIRQMEGESSRVDNICRQHAMHRRRRPEFYGGIDIVKPEFRSAGRQVWHARLHADAVADLEARHVRSNFGNRSRRLVPQHHRRVDDIGADAAMGVIMHIRAANADGVDGDFDIAGTKAQRQIDLAQRKLVLAFEHEGLHGCFPGAVSISPRLAPGKRSSSLFSGARLPRKPGNAAFPAHRTILTKSRWRTTAQRRQGSRPPAAPAYSRQSGRCPRPG